MSRPDGDGSSTLLLVGAAVVAFSGGLLVGSLRGRRPKHDGGSPEPAPDAAPVPAHQRVANGRFTPRREPREPPVAHAVANGVPATAAPTRANGAPATAAPARANGAPATAAPARADGAPATAAPARAIGAPGTAAPARAIGAASAPPPARAATSPARATRVRPPPPPPPPPPTRPRPAALSPPAARSRPPEPASSPARVAWPAGSTHRWRCEIAWRGSEFRAQANPPDSRRKTVVATSPEFENVEKDPAAIPRPELTSAVRDLATALEAQGWMPVAPGGRWYSRRFVWTHDGPPPGVEGAA